MIENKQGWISVKDELPEEEQEVILPIKKTFEFAIYRNNLFKKRDWVGTFNNFTHWMPLPNPPVND